MNWLEKDIADQYIAVGFPVEMANKMGVRMVEKMKEERNIKHRDLYPFIFIDNDVIMISSDLDSNVL